MIASRLLAAAVFVIAATGPVHAEDAGFRLLELDGHRVKWGNPALGTPATVTYAVATARHRFAGARNCPALDPPRALLARSGISHEHFAAALADALRAWSKVAGITFRRADQEHADILIGAELQPRGRGFTNVLYAGAKAGTDPRPITRAVICLNPRERWKIGFDGNLDVYDLRYTLTHELGHAIGLDHPGPRGGVMGFAYREGFDTLQAGDIAGAVLLYGAPEPQLAGPEAGGIEAGSAKRGG